MKLSWALTLLFLAGIAQADPPPAPTDEPGRIQRWAQPPIVVPPPIVEPPVRAQVNPLAPTLAPPPVTIERPVMPSACGINGCWSNNGTHLNLVPPACALQAGVVVCR